MENIWCRIILWCYSIDINSMVVKCTVKDNVHLEDIIFHGIKLLPIPLAYQNYVGLNGIRGWSTG